MNVALYARVSTQRQEKQGTIASQVEALRKYAKKQNYKIVEDYVCKDDGYSGASLARPALDRLRDGAQAALFDAVLVLSTDRLSRKYAYLILILEEFERLNTQVIFIEQPPGDDPHTALLVQIQGAVAEYERAKLAERHRRGKLFRARQGETFWNSIPYGYRRIPRRDGVPAHLVIHEAETEVVKKIFTWHAHEQMTIRQIAKRLTREGYPTPKRGPLWRETTVHKILRREAYLGTYYYNTSCKISVPVSEINPRGEKKVAKPRSEWIPVSIPAIIDSRTLQGSQMRHGPNQRFSPRNLQEEHWLLRRLVRCENCGFKCSCVADKRRPHMPPCYYYRCEKQDRVVGRPRCRPYHIRAEPLDDLIWCEVRKHLLHPELLLKAQSALTDTESLDRSILSTQLKNAGRRLQKLEAQRRRLIDGFQEGLVPKEEFQERTRSLEARIKNIQDDLTTLETEYKTALQGQELLTRIREFTTAVARKLDTMTFHEKQQLVRRILHEVVIHDNLIKLYFKIPLPRSKSDGSKYAVTSAEKTVSSKLFLRSRGSPGGDDEGRRVSRTEKYILACDRRAVPGPAPQGVAGRRGDQPTDGRPATLVESQLGIQCTCPGPYQWRRSEGHRDCGQVHEPGGPVRGKSQVQSGRGQRHRLQEALRLFPGRVQELSRGPFSGPSGLPYPRPV